MQAICITELVGIYIYQSREALPFGASPNLPQVIDQLRECLSQLYIKVVSYNVGNNISNVTID
jgi:hypothetical protein